jgi:glycine cleavage system aminomethyltransferase T
LSLLNDTPDGSPPHVHAVGRGPAAGLRHAGYIRSASYGFTLGGAVGLAMIDADEPINQAYLDVGEWTVQIGAEDYPAVASLRPMYDPANERIRI